MGKHLEMGEDWNLSESKFPCLQYSEERTSPRGNPSVKYPRKASLFRAQGVVVTIHIPQPKNRKRRLGRHMEGEARMGRDGKGQKKGRAEATVSLGSLLG